MHNLFPVLHFLVTYGWIIWPLALLCDVVLSVRRTPLRPVRWVFRVTHSLALAAVVTLIGVEFFWIDVVRVHYHGGPETPLVGLLVLYVSVRLSQQFDAVPIQADQAQRRGVAALLLPSISAGLLLAACVNEAAGIASWLHRLAPSFMFIVPLLSLITLQSLLRRPVRRAHVKLSWSLASGSLALAIFFFVAAGFRFFGFLPWVHDDDAWFYVLTGLVCFTILGLACSLRARETEGVRFG